MEKQVIRERLIATDPADTAEHWRLARAYVQCVKSELQEQTGRDPEPAELREVVIRELREVSS